MNERKETFGEACALVEHELDPLGTNGWKKMIDRIRAAHDLAIREAQSITKEGGAK